MVDLGSANTRMPLDIGQRLADAIEGRFEDGRVILPHTGASMRVELAEGGSNEQATIHLWVDHPSWDRTLFDAATGVGDTQDAAIKQAILNVGLHVVHLIDHLVPSNPDERFTTTWAGSEHQWSVWCGYIASMGKNDAGVDGSGAPYLNLLREEIKERLGNQKVTYLKVTAGWFSQEIIAEVRINNIISTKMTAMLYSHIEQTWPARPGVFHKQMMWIVQDEQTHQPYPHTYQDIRKGLIAAAGIFQQMWNGETAFDSNQYEARVIEAVGDPSLGMEIAALTPEIVAHHVYSDFHLDERGTIRSGGIDHEFSIHQLACFAHLTDAIESTWCKEVAEEVLRSWVDYSAVSNVIFQMREKGVDSSSVNPIHLNYGVGPGYILR